MARSSLGLSPSRGITQAGSCVRPMVSIGLPSILQNRFLICLNNVGGRLSSINLCWNSITCSAVWMSKFGSLVVSVQPLFRIR